MEEGGRMSKPLTVDGAMVEFLRAWVAWDSGEDPFVFENALLRLGLLSKSNRGSTSLTDRGRNLLAAHRHTEPETKQ